MNKFSLPCIKVSFDAIPRAGGGGGGLMQIVQQLPYLVPKSKMTYFRSVEMSLERGDTYFR